MPSQALFNLEKVDNMDNGYFYMKDVFDFEIENLQTGKKVIIDSLRYYKIIRNQNDVFLILCDALNNKEKLNTMLNDRETLQFKIKGINRIRCVNNDKDIPVEINIKLAELVKYQLVGDCEGEPSCPEYSFKCLSDIDMEENIDIQLD